MATSATLIPSVGGITSTDYKGIFVLSAQSNRYPHTAPGGRGKLLFTGARANLLDAAGNLPLPNGVPTVVEFSNTAFDTDGYFDDGDPTHLVIPTERGGVFEFGCSGLLVGTSGGEGLFQAFILRNDSDIIALGRLTVNEAIDGAVINLYGMFDLADDDNLSVMFSWNGDNDDSLQTDVEYSPTLWLGRWR